MLRAVLSTLIGGSLACLPLGTGPLYTSATFEYNISPPATWTFDTGDTGAAVSPAQQKSQDQAKSQVEKDFKSALTTVLKDNDLSINNVQYTIDYTPPEIIIKKDGAAPATSCNTAGTTTSPALIAAPANEYIDYGGTIISKCTEGVASPYSIKAGVTVKSPSPIYQSVWDNLNYQVQYELMLKKVQFNDAGTTTYKS